YDALLDIFEPNAKSAYVAKVFSNLREELVPFAQAIFEHQDRVSDEPLHRQFPLEQQETFGLMIARALGYDFKRGRQDKVVHPFCTSFSRNDVRITTRFYPDFLSPALFGTIHETGHALYEQGLSPELDGTFLADGVSLGVHESQSRLWENIVGRSYGFWSYFYPDAQRIFAGILDDVSLDEFYKAINAVKPSFIRVEADEVTYPLHIMLRFELELDILSGNLSLKDAPEAWNSKMQTYLGITPPNDSEGILQDVHWSSGIIGYFPTYALGTLLSAQLYEAALKDHPSIPEEIQIGKFDTLLEWMRTNIHQHGRRYMPDELIQKATGQSLTHAPYMRYLKEKYTPIYDL
ncbi:MAG: carboxypeptidase, partial [Phototrophicales bacterium]